MMSTEVRSEKFRNSSKKVNDGSYISVCVCVERCTYTFAVHILLVLGVCTCIDVTYYICVYYVIVWLYMMPLLWPQQGYPKPSGSAPWQVSTVSASSRCSSGCALPGCNGDLFGTWRRQGTWEYHKGSIQSWNVLLRFDIADFHLAGWRGYHFFTWKKLWFVQQFLCL